VIMNRLLSFPSTIKRYYEPGTAATGRSSNSGTTAPPHVQYTCNGLAGVHKGCLKALCLACTGPGLKVGRPLIYHQSVVRHFTDGLLKLIEIQRLMDEAVGSQLETLNQVSFLARRIQDHDWNGLRARVCLDCLVYLPSS
jgi:hypothetical protein